MRAAAWVAEGGRAAGKRADAAAGWHAPAPAPVVSRVVAATVAEGQRAARKEAGLAALPERSDPLLAAWVDFIRAHIGGEDMCFLSGSYGEEYGYSHGLMLARNVQRDFKRTLKALDLEDRDYTCSVETHKSGRPVLHLHALIGDLDPATRQTLRSYWLATRGWCTADPCYDGGIDYCSKYALKNGSSADTFDWSWRS